MTPPALAPHALATFVPGPSVPAVSLPPTGVEVTSSAASLQATVPLRTAATGGSATLVLLVFAALFVATVLSLYLAARLCRGYRAGGGRSMLGLFVGLVLLTTVPILARLVLTNVGGVPATTRALVATASQLLGLLVVLGVVYDRG